ncbi:MAG: NAD(P)H-binding protein [Chloroflexota bacterium]
MSKAILVVGATGNTGRSLVKQLVKRGEEVLAATRQPESYPAQLHVTPVYFDYACPETYAAALAGVDRVFALVDPADTGDPVYEPFLARAQAAGVAHMVITTTMPLLRSDGQLHTWKEAETPLLDSGIPYTILRPCWFMQMFTDEYNLPSIQQKRTISIPIGDAQISFIDTQDIAAVAAVTLTEPGHTNKIYTLTGGEAIGLTEIAAAISEASGYTVTYQPLSMEEWAEKMQVRLGSSIFRVYSYLYKTALQGGFARAEPTVQNLTGVPPTTFAEFAHKQGTTWQ